MPSIPLPDITKTGSGTVGGGQYTGGDGSGKSAFESSAISDNSELKGLFSKFMNDMKASSFFQCPALCFIHFRPAVLRI